LQTSTQQQSSKEYTPPAVCHTRSRVASDNDLRSKLCTGETRSLTNEKKV
jgi:hypothetical protein